MDEHSISLIGFGNMGRALAEGWLAQDIPADAITVIDPSDDARSRARALGVKAAAVLGDSSRSARIVVLAVKPDRLDAVLKEQAGSPAPAYLSIVAGKTLSSMGRILGPDAALVRAMPNTPAAIGCGVTALCASEAVGEAERDLCTRLMQAVGQVEWVASESMMDAITAVSGSGPAYVFLLIECLTAAARDVGLDPELAARLATATVAGAGRYAEQSPLDAAELRQRVTSPNGTTQAALDVLMADDALQALFRKAVHAATERSRELSLS